MNTAYKTSSHLSEAAGAINAPTAIRLLGSLNLSFIVFNDLQSMATVINPSFWSTISDNDSPSVLELKGAVVAEDKIKLDELLKASGSKDCIVYLRFISKTNALVAAEVRRIIQPEDNSVTLVLQPTIHFDVEQYRAQLEETKYRLKEAEAAINDFAYTASHDMQEPVRKLNTYIERLLSKIPQSTDIEPYTVRIADATARLKQMIEDLLSFSRFTRKREEFSLVDLNSVVESILKERESEIKDLQATFSVSGLPAIEGSETQLKKLFNALIDNSLKFRSKTKNPEINVFAKQVMNDERDILIDSVPKYSITVTDNGIGFQQEFAENIFKLFTKLNSKHEYGGTGVGLAICRRITENHQGFITAIGRENEGARFIIVLPQRQQGNERN